MVERIPLLRSEITGAFDQGESASVLSIMFKPTFSNPNMPSLANPSLGAGALTTNRPIIIYDYKMEVITDVATALYQYYCDDDEVAQGGSNWSTTSEEFALAVKQYKISAGNINQNDAIGSPPRKSVLYYKAKRYWSKKHKQWKWIRPPIVLSSNKKNTFGLSVNNLSTTLDDRSYYAFVSIKNWHYLD